MNNNRNILITSALPYVNNVPHLGNIIGSVLSADVYARYCRNMNYNTLFIGGTDEYGTATETMAIKEKLTPQEICDKYHEIHKQIYEWFNISFDKFGRTSSHEHTNMVQYIFNKCYENNYINDKNVEQLYCEKCNKFLADRFVEGICPKCNYESARGDQCDNCQHIYNATELINPRCNMNNCLSKPIIKSSKHLFLKLEDLHQHIKEWYNNCDKSKWNKQAAGITDAWLNNKNNNDDNNNKLNNRCITRDLEWGVQVPNVNKHDEYANKVFYVWFDAPIGYISITASLCKNWEFWWKNPDDVELYQFMGKDNVSFHSVMFPGSLIATGENWTKVNGINCTSYLTYEGEKFSKSRNVGIFGNSIQDLDIPSFVWRYYLISIRPVDSDSNFTWKEFINKNNNELLANIGNLFFRGSKFCWDKYNGIIPNNIHNDTNENIIKWRKQVEKDIEKHIEYMENRDIKNGLNVLMHLSSLGNKFWQECEPWKIIKTNKNKCDTILNIFMNFINCVVHLLEPFIPSFSSEIFKQLNIQKIIFNDKNPLNIFKCCMFNENHKINEPYIIIKNICSTKIDEYYKKFSGNK